MQTNFIVGAKWLRFIICRFVAINGVGVYLYAIVYQAQDEEDYGGAWEVLKEGMLTSSAFFVVSASVNWSVMQMNVFQVNWILWYTACHYG